MSSQDQSEIEAIRCLYSLREPANSDTWSPVNSDLELWHRARLLVEACRSLRQFPQALETVQVLDVGCGVGRSSRMLIDLGVRPSNLFGIDLRETAIAYARQMNPAITFRHIADLDAWPTERFDLAIQCTVFSSIAKMSLRKRTAALMEQSVGQRGYILWWDCLKANDFAGGDDLDPVALFPRRKLVSLRKVTLQPSVQDSFRHLRGLGPWLSSLLCRFGHYPTHAVALLGPIER
jgi:SAM-dependent methyltransferase